MVLVPTTPGNFELLSTLVESKRICQGILGLESVSSLAGTHSSLSSQHPFLGELGMSDRSRVRVQKRESCSRCPRLGYTNGQDFARESQIQLQKGFWVIIGHSSKAMCRQQRCS